MSIIIIGAGEVGYNVARKLSQERKDIIVIDKDEEKVERVAETLDVQAIHGSGSSISVLKEAGIERAEILIAATNSDEVNMVSCLVAGVQAIVPVKIARIRDPEYASNEKILGKEKLDIDLVINTDQEMVNSLLRILDIPGARDVVDFAEGRIRIASFMVEPGNPVAGKSLAELRKDYSNLELVVVAIYRDHRVIIPRGKDRLKERDLVYVLGESAAISQFLASFRDRKGVAPPTKVMIFGGGNVSLLLAKALEERGVATKVIEPDIERCQYLAQQLDKAIVLKGDFTSHDLLEEEHVREMDAFIALTEDEDRNILLALLAKTMGARRVIASINRVSFAPLAYQTGVDVVVSPPLLAVNRILQYIRKGKILNVAILPEEQAEVIETVAMETSDIIERPLKDLKLPSGILIGAILREGQVIIPRGESVILPGDKVTLVASSAAIPQLEKFLTVKLEYW